MPLDKADRIFWRRQKSFDQSQCPLFSTLPLEIREVIYEYTSYFPEQPHYRKGLDIHIFTHQRKLVWRRCSGIDGSCTVHCYRGFYGNTPRSLNLLAVVLTCRRIYSEAIPILYARNAFKFSNLAAITSFTSTVLPHRLNCIRSLHLEWFFRDYDTSIPGEDGICYEGVCEKPFDSRWDALWDVLARMRGLRVLVVRLHGDFWDEVGAWDELIFGPMRRVEGLRGIEIEADWAPRHCAVGSLRVDVVSGGKVEWRWED
ncbi:hypothetical protein BJX64DRAFT_291888 [Aspergillus heterothallicus]